MMKRIVLITGILLFAVAPVVADLYVVELGTPASEVLYGVNTTTEPSTPPPAGWPDWGSYVGPPTGGYGGISTDPGSYDKKCRMVWGGGGGTYDEYNWAEIVFPVAVESVTIRHLDGTGDDSFDVHVDGNFWGDYTAVVDTDKWVRTSFSGAPGTTLRITATASSWGGFLTWGQLGIDRVEAVPVPVPAAVLLGILGLGAAGVKLRKFA